HTIAGYRSTFRLLLRFAATETAKTSSALDIAELSASSVESVGCTRPRRLRHVCRSEPGHGVRGRPTRDDPWTSCSGRTVVVPWLHVVSGEAFGLAACGC